MNNSVKAHFDCLAPEYRKNFSDIKSGKNFEFYTRRRLIEKLVADHNGFLLDCACGTGEIAATALESGSFQYSVLVDLSNEMLAFAKQLIATGCVKGTIEYKQIDIFKYKPQNNIKFDLILCVGLIAHTAKLIHLLDHLKSMISPKGKIILQSSLANHWFIKSVRLLTSRKQSARQGYELSYFTMADIERACHGAGMKIIDVKRYCFGLPFGDRLFPLGNYWLEVAVQRFSAKFGSEAIFVLCQ